MAADRVARRPAKSNTADANTQSRLIQASGPVVTNLGVGLSRRLTFAKVLTNAFESLPCVAAELRAPVAASAGFMANISVALTA